MSLPVQEGAGPDLAKAALQQGRFREAVEYATAQTSADSGNFGAWQVLGAAQSSSGNHAAAVAAFSQAAQLQPLSAPAHFNLAKALIAAGDNNRAQAELQSCLTLDPQYQKARDVLQQLNPGGLPPVSGGMAPQPASPPAPAWGPPPVIGTAPTSTYAPGQAPSPFGAAPMGGQPAGQPSTFGQPAPPGQYGPAQTQPGGYPSSATLIGQRPGGYAPPQSGLPSVTQAWAISGLVLGTISLGLYTLGMLGAALSNKVGALSMTLETVNVLISLLFIIGSCGILVRKVWGRSILMGTTITAIVMLVVAVMVLFTDPGTTATVGFNSPQSASFLQSVRIGAVVFLLLEALYCALLFLHIKSDRVKALMVS